MTSNMLSLAVYTVLGAHMYLTGFPALAGCLGVLVLVLMYHGWAKHRQRLNNAVVSGAIVCNTPEEFEKAMQTMLKEIKNDAEKEKGEDERN